jgi:hypothetical protein
MHPNQIFDEENSIQNPPQLASIWKETTAGPRPKNSLKTRDPGAAAALFLHSSSANAEPVNVRAGLLACSAGWAAFPFLGLIFDSKTNRKQWRAGPTPM